MFSKHLLEVMNFLNAARKLSVYTSNKYENMQLKTIVNSNFCPASYEDIILELSNGKILYCKDFEFSDISGNNITLGNYVIKRD